MKALNQVIQVLWKLSLTLIRRSGRSDQIFTGRLLHHNNRSNCPLAPTEHWPPLPVLQIAGREVSRGGREKRTACNYCGDVWGAAGRSSASPAGTPVCSQWASRLERSAFLPKGGQKTDLHLSGLNLQTQLLPLWPEHKRRHVIITDYRRSKENMDRLEMMFWWIQGRVWSYLRSSLGHVT